jgi:hypothetical protein
MNGSIRASAKVADSRLFSASHWGERVLFEGLRREAEALILGRPAPEAKKDAEKR